MYSTSITNNGATIEVISDPNGPHNTLREAWLHLKQELEAVETPKNRWRANNKNIALWIEVNLPTLKPNCPYNFSHY